MAEPPQINYNNINIYNQTISKELFQYLRNKFDGKYALLQEKQSTLCVQSKTWLLANKLKIGINSCIIGYVALQVYGTYLRYQLSRPNCWSLWKQYNDHLITEQLLAAIQQRYTTPATVADAIRPLICFMKDIETEEKQLRAFIVIGGMLEKIYLAPFSCYNPELKKLFEQRLEHLAVIKTTFLTWMSDYKLKTGLSTNPAHPE
jgi:hypothetical protein